MKKQIALFTMSMLALACAAENEWPREIDADGRGVLMYQPQLDKLDGNMLHARAAVSILPTGEEMPIFGAIWIETRIETDLSSRMVSFGELRIPKVHFSDITPEQEKQFVALLTREIPTWNLTLSQDRMLSMLDIAEKQNMASDGFDDRPPKILVADEPTVLVNIDGDPLFGPIEGSRLESVINTPFLILREGKKLYLYGGAKTWYTSVDLMGPWSVAPQVPANVLQQEPSEEELNPDEPANENEKPPAILVTTEPTELIVIDGLPQHKVIADNKLTSISNADAELFMDLETQRYFVLLSGRWFASRSYSGPWEFVAADALPASFSKIPAGSEEAEARPFVAGTEEAKEAVLEAHIPQTAAIRRDATITVSYDGEPQFEKIQETRLSYAMNTEFQIIQADEKFYCAEQGAWYVANAANGPWITAIEIPDEIHTIPASNPMYNVKFLYIYGYNDDVVYFGYYPGYTHSYVYHETIVYGTGWYYRPWCHRYHYYPRHCTWGWHMRWHRWHGWGMGSSYSTGRYSFSIGYRSGYRRGWWGPSGYRRGYQRGYRQGYNAAQRNIYQNKDNAKRVAQTARRPDTQQPRQASNQQNNVFTDQQGNVMRRNNQGQWEGRQNGQWTGATPESKPDQKPRQQPNPTLDRDYNARDRGNQRSNSFQQSQQPSRASRPSGVSRGGGGRR